MGCTQARWYREASASANLYGQQSKHVHGQAAYLERVESVAYIGEDKSLLVSSTDFKIFKNDLRGLATEGNSLKLASRNNLSEVNSTVRKSIKLYLGRENVILLILEFSCQGALFESAQCSRL